MIEVGIIGASGYTGHELIKLLNNHKKVKVVAANSRTYEGKRVSELYPDYRGNLRYTNFSVSEINSMKPDLLFLALPHGNSTGIVQQLDKDIKVIDLGADFRFSSMKMYEKVYGIKSPVKKNTAVYGLPELFREKIKKAHIVANPGCYSTACILAAYPIQKYAKYIVFDCKSGWSGAGKDSVYAKNPSIVKDNLIAYNIVKHRHKYEISQFIKTPLSFTPHVISTFQGMMCTAHILLRKNTEKEKIIKIYKKFYNDSKFTRIADKIPEVRDTQKTNFCRIGGFEIDENNQLVIVSTIDNLLKGASGQAVQNMNLMFDFDETEGLI
ncbi:MAG TPA: N-acetyl-gamma-glutamyl-phosphate reductase [Candidatus Nanoarchaeia archaeon]|nr:N-acetyl-gamma-glutamyl-phosphate reductase [Candidatus Nanoarchaeia archaeon]